MKRKTGGAAEDEEIARLQLDIGVGTAAIRRISEAEDARITERQGDDWCVGSFVAVLMQTHFGGGPIPVNKRDVGFVLAADGGGDSVAAELTEPKWKGLYW
jgi:hypothetical protein